MNSGQTIIEPGRNPFKVDFPELYRYRELLWTLTYRDLRVKYAQTAIGVLWAFLNPILTLLVLSFVFGTIAKVETPGRVPHLLYTIAGMCGWTYFASVAAESGDSIIGAENMIKKIYFPRLVIPLSKALTAFIDLAVVLGCLATLMIYYGVTPGRSLLYLPLFLLMAVLCGLAAGIWLSALTIRYRDFRHVVPLLLRMGMYAAPIAYPASLVPAEYRALYYANPLAGVVEGLRWSILSGPPPHPYIYNSFIFVFIVFIGGVVYFNKMERVMPDIV